MEAILAGMIEGVPSSIRGRLQLANDAARRMLRLDEPAIGRHYVETIRHPAIAELVAAALAGGAPDALQLSPPRDPSRTLDGAGAPVAPERAPAPCSCCTTSPNCGAPIKSGATSSRTSRTNCARRSPRSAATWRRCPRATRRRRRQRFLEIILATRCAWSGSSGSSAAGAARRRQEPLDRAVRHAKPYRAVAAISRRPSIARHQHIDDRPSARRPKRLRADRAKLPRRRCETSSQCQSTARHTVYTTITHRGERLVDGLHRHFDDVGTGNL